MAIHLQTTIEKQIMKSKIIVLSTFLLTIALFGFENKNEISKCLLSFTTAINLTAGEPERLPETSEKVRTVETENGEVEVTRIDGYRVLYNNDKKVPFVNLKVELSDPNSYEIDQKKILDNLKYLNEHSSGMETKELIEFNFNGYKISGLSRGSIEAGSTLGIFVMFPGNGVTAYFYFNNLKPDVRNFESIEDYKKQRDRFINDYTQHLKTCNNK
jgi:hypothetical protein